MITELVLRHIFNNAPKRASKPKAIIWTFNLSVLGPENKTKARFELLYLVAGKWTVRQLFSWRSDFEACDKEAGAEVMSRAFRVDTLLYYFERARRKLFRPVSHEAVIVSVPFGDRVLRWLRFHGVSERHKTGVCLNFQLECWWAGK